MNNEPILLIFRGDSILFKKNEIIDLIEEEWFLSNLLNMDFKDDSNPDKLEIPEDKNTAMSLIDTMRYNRLIVYPNVSLDYMIALSHKWCLPDYINELIIDRIIQNVNVNKMESNFKSLEFDEIDTKITFQCINCKGGFKVYENTSESCSFHPEEIHYVARIRQCCGKAIDSPPCTKSYHVMSLIDQNFYYDLKVRINNLNKINKK